MNDETTSEKLLKTPLSVFVTNIISEANTLQRVYGEYLSDPQEGYYTFNSIYPKLCPDRVYYQEDDQYGKKLLHPVKSFDDIRQAVYDERGCTVLTKMQARMKDKILFSSPQLPVTAMRLVYHLMQNQLDIICPYRRFTHHTSDKILSLIKPGYENLYHDSDLESLITPLIQKLHKFIGNDTWNMYFQKWLGNDVIIEKMCDYRIYDWYLIKENKKLDQQDWGD